MFGLIITIIIFILGMLFFLIWQPTRLLLKEIFFNPFKDSTFKVVKGDTSVPRDVVSRKPKNNQKKKNPEESIPHPANA